MIFTCLPLYFLLISSSTCNHSVSSLSLILSHLSHLSRPVNNFLRLVEIRVDVQNLTTRAKNKEKSVFDVSITFSFSVNDYSPPSSVFSYSQWWDSIDFSSLEDYPAPAIKRNENIVVPSQRSLPFIHFLFMGSIRALSRIRIPSHNYFNSAGDPQHSLSRVRSDIILYASFHQFVLNVAIVLHTSSKGKRGCMR